MASKLPTTPRICSHCHAWPIGVDEVYCGGCGELSVELEIKPNLPILVASLPNTHQRPIILSNSGAQDLKIEIQAAVARPWLSHSPSSLTVPAKKMGRFALRLDAGKLPQNFRVERLDYLLVLNGNERTTKIIQVMVKAGPKPKAEPVDFGELQEGSIQLRRLRIDNEGGLPFNLLRVEPVGTLQLTVDDLELPIKVHPGEETQVPVRWDTNILGEGDPKNAGFELHFSQGEVLFAPAHASLYRYRLTSSPERILLEGSARSAPSQAILLKNQGTIDVEIASIRGSASWIQTGRGYDGTVLKAAEPGKPEAESELDFEVSCLTEDLDIGHHRGKVLVETADPELQDLQLDLEIRVFETEPYLDYIGIDFGTTNSVVSILESDGDPGLVEIEESGSTTFLIPSLLYFTQDGTTQIGHRAFAASGGNPQRVVRSIKRVMGYNEGIEIDGEIHRPEHIAAEIIRHLVLYAERQLLRDRQKYFDVQRAIVTVPANFFDLQIQAILDACDGAGLETERDAGEQAAKILKQRTGSEVNSTIVLDEPSAAALYFLYYLIEQRSFAGEVDEMVARENGLHLLVYDHGGGTLDISVAQVTRLEDGSVGLRFLATKGDNTIGGDHLDVMIMGECLKNALVQMPDFDPSLIEANHREIQQRREREGWSTEDWIGVAGARQAWKELAEALKISLSTGEREEASGTLPGWAICRFEAGQLIRGAGEVKLRLSQKVLSNLLGARLEEGMRLIDKALAAAGIVHHEVDFVLHAGRQSLLNMVQGKVAARFPQLPEDRLVLDKENLLKTCVARGAALFGRMRHDSSGGGIRVIQERRLPHAYGVARQGAFGQLELEEVIPRGEEYPVEIEKVFEAPPTGRFSVRLYQNTGTSSVIRGNEEVHEVGHFEHLVDPSAAEELSVRFEVDRNRRLSVHIGEQVVEIHPTLPAQDLDWLG